jgi:RNA polymerase sigma factor (sigma-70 family)
MATSQMNEVMLHLRRTLLPREGAGRTDAQLLEDYLRRRDDSALATLVVRHGPMVWGVCRRVLADYHDAEDAFQATFLVLVRKAACVMPRAMLANWLYGVAHQTALKARAGVAKRKGREIQMAKLPEPAVTDEKLWGDLQPLLDEELSRLPDRYRVVIVLCDLEGKTRNEAAQQLGCPEGTVAGRLARGRGMLAKRLAKRGITLTVSALTAVLAQNLASAGMPISVATSTIGAATLFAAGQTAADVISVKVAALAEEVVKTMLLTKCKLATATLAVIATTLLGAGWLTYGAAKEDVGGANKVAPGVPIKGRVVDDAPKNDAKLPPGMEENLRWGEPVNGLRAALAIRPAPGGTKSGDTFDLYLVVQNVSKAALHFADTTEVTRLRELYGKIDGEIKYGLTSDRPTHVDVMLQPREVTFLVMFPPDKETPDGKTVGSIIAEGALKDTRQTLVAHLQIEKAPAGAWTSKLVTGETSGAAAAGHPEPKNKQAKVLFKMWQDNARKNGDIPGGLVGRLGDKVREFIRFNTGDASGDPYARKMAPLVPRFNAAGDWKPAEVTKLMDDIAAVTTIPLETTIEETAQGTFKSGAPLHKELAKAPWGEAQANGLRIAWLLEPRATEHRLNTPLKSRILIHNSGKATAVFRTRTWHQSGGHKARDAQGAEINIDSTEWTTIGQLTAFRLAPGEFVEVVGAGIGVGANKDDEDWRNTRVGSWIDAKAGDEVTFTPDAVPLNDWNEAVPQGGQPGWWPDFIAKRLARDLPLPADADERTRILNRAVRELFGTAPTAEETAAFVADRDPGALDALAKRLAQRAGFTPSSGPLTSGATKFRVLPVDPDAAKKPRTASNPGEYTLTINTVLKVTRRLVGERIVNEASILVSSPDPTQPPAKHEIRLPDDHNTWVAAWVRGTTVLWVRQKGSICSYDFTDPAQVKETTFKESSNFVPRPILDALRAALDLPGLPRPTTESPK